MKLCVLAVAASIALSLAPRVARADLAPPDTCSSPGEACNNAPPDYASPGTCVSQTCQKRNPDDGGTYEYQCALCVPSSGTGSTTGGATSTTTSTGSTGSTSTGSGTTSGAPSSDAQDSGGCAMRAPACDGVLACVMIALGAGALAIGRKRRR